MNTKSEIVILDLETSGIETNGNGVIEFRALIVHCKTHEIISSFNLLTKPDAPAQLPKIVEELTEINNVLLKDAPSNKVALQQFEKYAGNRAIWTYNLPFVSKFLNKISGKDFLLNDIISQARKHVPELKGSSLQGAASTLGIEAQDGLGRMRDCHLAKDLLIKSL